MNAGTPPTLFNSDGTNNGATVHDTSFLGTGCAGSTCHDFFGVAYTNSALLSPVTRLTDVNASPEHANAYTPGQGGSGSQTLTNTNTSLVALGTNGGLELIGLFNTATGQCNNLPPGCTPGVNCVGTSITRNQCTGVGCSVGTTSQSNDFGTIVFSPSDPTLVFTYGNNLFDISSLTQVTPYSISTSTGAYSLKAPVVDFVKGLPVSNASEWATGHSYSFGNYVKRTLLTSEMATGGTWCGPSTTSCIGGHTYSAGDIVTSHGGSINCAYVSVLGGTAGGTAPAFITSAPCKNNQVQDGSGNAWRGLSSTAVFLYQETNPSCSPCTSSAFSVSGHPDLLSTVTDGSATWTNTGPSYIPVTGNSFWMSNPGMSNDSAYSPYAGAAFPSRYSVAMSTNTYGCSTGLCSSTGYTKYNATQNTGHDVVSFDATASPLVFHHLDTATGIWVDFPCTGASGATCTLGTPATVGALTNITTLGTGGTPCPFMLHESSLNKIASAPYVAVSEGMGYLGAGTACTNQTNFQVWNPLTSAYNPTTSLQTSYSGFNHSNMDGTTLVAFSGTGCGGSNLGCFSNIYSLGAGVSVQPKVGTYLYPSPSPSGYPQECNSNIATLPSWNNPTCSLGSALDGHVSCVGGCDHGSLHACGTFYNYANLGPSFNAWQNMEVCIPTAAPLTYASAVAGMASFGPPAQFTHTFATGTCPVFDCQFQISEYSQDGNWLFWSSDWGCSLGVVKNASTPTVWGGSGGAYQLLQHSHVTGDGLPSSLITLCGYPWQPVTAYVVGNVINPIEGTGGTAPIDDVFQAIYACGGGTCLSGPTSSLASKQPKCAVNKSCFANTKPPGTSVIIRDEPRSVFREWQD